MSWQEEFKSSVKTTDELSNYLNEKVADVNYPILIPPFILKKIKKDNIFWKQFVPSKLETDHEGLLDPIGDKTWMKSSQIIHRYENRVLFLPTKVCPIVCRYCFRKNEISTNDELFSPDFEKTIQYLKEHSEVKEVIFSGGDPLILSNEKIKYFLEAFSKIDHIKFIRFHSRFPVTIPSRVDDDFLELLKSFSRRFVISLAVHTNHADELEDPLVESAIEKLAQANIHLLSQSVLLKDVNDSEATLKDLYIRLAELKVVPYYLHHPDKVKGGMHFYLSLEKGREIYSKLRKELSGWMLPKYILDLPGGHGKVEAYNSESMKFSGSFIAPNNQKIVNYLDS